MHYYSRNLKINKPNAKIQTESHRKNSRLFSLKKGTLNNSVMLFYLSAIEGIFQFLKMHLHAISVPSKRLKSSPSIDWERLCFWLFFVFPKEERISENSPEHCWSSLTNHKLARASLSAYLCLYVWMAFFSCHRPLGGFLELLFIPRATVRVSERWNAAAHKNIF